MSQVTGEWENNLSDFASSRPRVGLPVFTEHKAVACFGRRVGLNIGGGGGGGGGSGVSLTSLELGWLFLTVLVVGCFD